MNVDFLINVNTDIYYDIYYDILSQNITAIAGG